MLECVSCGVQYGTVLCYAVLYCAVLCCTVLCDRSVCVHRGSGGGSGGATLYGRWVHTWSCSTTTHPASRTARAATSTSTSTININIVTIIDVGHCIVYCILLYTVYCILYTVYCIPPSPHLRHQSITNCTVPLLSSPPLPSCKRSINRPATHGPISHAYSPCLPPHNAPSSAQPPNRRCHFLTIVLPVTLSYPTNSPKAV